MARNGAHTDTIGSTPTEALQMPARTNSHENGLRQSARLHEQRKNEDWQEHKTHTAFGTLAATKVALCLFSLVTLATNLKLPEHWINPKKPFTEQVMSRFHEVNEIYDGTLNEVDNLFYATSISTTEIFTFRNAMEQDDKLNFVDAMEKEISDHKRGKHWSMVHRDTLPNRARPIKSICSFERKGNQMESC